MLTGTENASKLARHKPGAISKSFHFYPARVSSASNPSVAWVTAQAVAPVIPWRPIDNLAATQQQR
jgi:hypothetical protein